MFIIILLCCLNNSDGFQGLSVITFTMIHIIFIASIKVHKILPQVNWELGNTSSPKQTLAASLFRLTAQGLLPLGLCLLVTPLGHTQGQVALTLSMSSQKEGPQDHSAQGSVNWVSH